MPRTHPVSGVTVVQKGERPEPSAPPPIPEDPLAELDARARAGLPNLIVIGAGKCGTSALHFYLSQHPEIGMSKPKELQLFGGPRWLTRLPTYVTHFDASRPVRGESSPSYSMDPFFPCVPEQMAAVLPEPRFVYLVAEPVRRTVAHWAEQHLLRNDERSLEEALSDADDPLNPYVAGSRYGHQLERYTCVFGRERVLVLEQEDLRERRDETLRRVFSFLGVDPKFTSPAFGQERNAAGGKIEPHALGRWMQDRWYGRSPLGQRLSTTKWLAGRPLRRHELDAATRARLVEVLRPDIARFRELSGLSPRWSTTP
jgi:Sulfotransferase domain